MKLSRVLAALVCATAVILGIWFHSQGGLPLNPSELRGRIAEFGWVAPFGFVAIAALRPVFALPSAVVMVAGGLVFGVVSGTILSSLGFTLGAVLGFSLARALGRDAVQRRMGDRLARADAFLSRRGARWLGAYTALPVSVLTPVHAGAGLSNMRLAAFTLWVGLGLVPRAGLYSYFGDSFTRGGSAVVTAGVVLAIVGIAGIFGLRRMLGSGADGSQGELASEAVASKPDSSDSSGTSGASGADIQT